MLAPNGSFSNRDPLYPFCTEGLTVSNFILQTFSGKVNKNFGAIHPTIKIAGVHARLINSDLFIQIQINIK